MLETISQLTVGTAAVMVLGFTVREFLRRLRERDKFLETLIDNHFKHSQDRNKRIAEILNLIYFEIKEKK